MIHCFPFLERNIMIIVTHNNHVYKESIVQTIRRQTYQLRFKKPETIIYRSKVKSSKLGL